MSEQKTPCERCGGTFRGAVRAARLEAEQAVLKRLATGEYKGRGVRLTYKETWMARALIKEAIESRANIDEAHRLMEEMSRAREVEI